MRVIALQMVSSRGVRDTTTSENTTFVFRRQRDPPLSRVLQIPWAVCTQWHERKDITFRHPISPDIIPSNLSDMLGHHRQKAGAKSSPARSTSSTKCTTPCIFPSPSLAPQPARLRIGEPQTANLPLSRLTLLTHIHSLRTSRLA